MPSITQPNESNLNRKGLLYALTVSLAFLAAYLAGHWHYLVSLCDQPGDYSLILLEVEKSKTFGALLGAYSRFRFRHPGPFAFYFYAAMDPLLAMLGTAQARASIAQLALNTICVWASLACVALHTKKQIAPAFLFVLFAFEMHHAMRGAWHEIWGPASLIAPVFCFLCISASLASGSARFFLFWATSASFAVSNHVGSLILVAPISVISVWCLIRAKQKEGFAVSRCETSSLVLGVLVAAAAACPIFVDMLVAPGLGNVGTLLRFFGSEHEHLSPIDAFSFVSYYYTAPLRVRGSIGSAVAVALIAFPFFVKLPRLSFMWYLRLFAMLAAVIMIIGAGRIAGKPAHSLMMYGFAAASITLFLDGYTLSQALSLRCALQSNRIAFALLSLLIAASVWLGLFSRVSKFECSPRFDKVTAWIEPRPADMHRFDTAGPKQWRSLSAIVLRLYRMNVPVCVAPAWSFMFGEDLTCKLDEKRLLRRFEIVAPGTKTEAQRTFSDGSFYLQETSKDISQSHHRRS